MPLNGFVEWLQQLRLDSLLDTVLIVAASLLCITIHETCHGLAAYWMGDDTAKRMGRLSLNPLRHIDLMGLVMMALVHFGWAKPVPVDMRKFRRPKLGMALTALAGPLSNVVLALAAMALRSVALFLMLRFPAQPFWEEIVIFLEYMAILSAGLAVFNLFPVPPLDGSKVLFALLPDSAYEKLMRYERYGMLLLAVLLLTGVLDTPLLFLRRGLLNGISFLTDPIFWLLAQNSL